LHSTGALSLAQDEKYTGDNANSATSARRSAFDVDSAQTDEDASFDLEFAFLGDPSAKGSQHIAFVAAGTRGVVYFAGRNSETTAIKYSLAANTACQTTNSTMQSRLSCWVDSASLISYLQMIPLTEVARNARIPLPSTDEFLKEDHWPSGGTTMLSPSNTEAEWRFSVEAAALPATMGVNSAIDRRLISLPLLSPPHSLFCSCCSLFKNCEVLTLELVVERQLLFSYTAATLYSDNLLSKEDSFVLYCNWMSDQLSFFRNLGRMHLDGQLKNILVKNVTGVLVFAWNDFGLSTTSKENETGNSTIKSLQQFAQHMIPHFVPPCYTLNEVCVELSLDTARTNMMFHWPNITTRFVAALISDRMQHLEVRVHSLAKENAALVAQNADQADQLRRLAAENADQTGSIRLLTAEIKVLRSQYDLLIKYVRDLLARPGSISSSDGLDALSKDAQRTDEL
jgi:hypothetical protein